MVVIFSIKINTTKIALKTKLSSRTFATLLDKSLCFDGHAAKL